MGTRLELHEILCGVLGSKNVYFQPPESVKMKYPAIVYSKSSYNNKFADNDVYSTVKQYEIIVIDADSDSTIPDKVNQLPTVRFSRHYTSDNLNHDVFTIYY